MRTPLAVACRLLAGRQLGQIRIVQVLGWLARCLPPALLAALALLAACATAPTAAPTMTPGVVVMRTAAPPSATASPAGSPSPTVIVWAPPTKRPTATPWPSATPCDGRCPTATLRPTLTPGPTYTPSRTPLPTFTPSTPLYGAGTPLPRNLQPITAANADRLALLARWETGPVYDLDTSRDEHWLAVVNEQAVQLFDQRTGTKVPFAGVGADSVSFSPGGRLLVTVGSGTVRLYRVTDGRLVFEGAGGWEWDGPLFSPDSRWMTTIPGDGRILVYRLSDGRLMFEAEGEWARYALDGELLITEVEHGDAVLRVYRIDGASQVLEMALEHSGARRFSPDETLCAIAAEDTTHVYRMIDGSLLYSIAGDAPEFSPGGSMIATSAGVYRTMDGSLLYPIAGDSAEFSPDGALLATSAGLYRSGDGSLIRAMEGGYPHPFSPDGRLLVTEDDGTIQVWRIDDGHLVGQYEAYEAWFSNDSKLLVMRGDRAAIRVYRVEDGSRAVESSEGPFWRLIRNNALLMAFGEQVGIYRVEDGSRVLAAERQWIEPDGPVWGKTPGAWVIGGDTLLVTENWTLSVMRLYGIDDGRPVLEAPGTATWLIRSGTLLAVERNDGIDLWGITPQ